MNQYKQAWAAHADCLDTPTTRMIERQMQDKYSPLRVATHVAALPVAAGLDALATGLFATVAGPSVLAVAASIGTIVVMGYFAWSLYDYYAKPFTWLLGEFADLA
jgi:hypothetical protein